MVMDPRHENDRGPKSPENPVTRRRFLRDSALGTMAAGSVLGGCAGPGPLAPSGLDVLATPASVGERNGIPYRAFGKTGEKVSILGVGGYHIGVQTSTQESVNVIRTCIDEGVNFLDNAWEYNDGRSEIRMGHALTDGYRDKVFLMTKVCGRDRGTAMKNLEESLRRLKTDVIDLWQFHECNYEDDAEMIFAKEGAIHAAVKAREQGKVRFVGFTGHKSPHLHLKMLSQDFDWDAVQMPLNVCDWHYRSFAQEVLPVALKRGMGVIGMKSQGGDGKIPSQAGLTVADCLNYCFSLNIPVCLSGMKTVEEARHNIGVARSFQPLDVASREGILARVREVALQGGLERFKSTRDFDSTVHQKQHGVG